MRIRKLRTRIIVFFAALLAVVQLAAFGVVSYANSTNARHKIDTELQIGERIFGRLLDQNRERLTQAARVLSADYAFREALATHDDGTVESALRNHGARIKADVAIMAGLDGTVLATTQDPAGRGKPFPLSELLEMAQRDGGAAALGMLGDTAYQVVIVPVMAPLPIGWIALGFQVDDTLATDLRKLTSLNVTFLSHSQGKGWTPLASTVDAGERALLFSALSTSKDLIALDKLGTGDAEQQVNVISLARHGQSQIVAVLQRSVADAMRSFTQLSRTLLFLGLGSLGLTVIGSGLLALGITRPLDTLAAATRRIREGDYTTAVHIERIDEIGILAEGLDHMREGIANREQEILRLAYRDTLTDLPNRALFNDRLSHAIESARRSGRSLTVLMMDLDRFKYVNDTLGHSVGDHVLREVAIRLAALLRESDTVARLGGDEFAIMLEGAVFDRVSLVAHKVLRALEEPIVYSGQPVDVGTSIGIAHFPVHGEDAGTLLRNADIAMYVAKRNKSGFAVFDPEYDTSQQRHLSLLGELRRAVERNELRLFYQPKLTVATRAIASAEALLRWEHPERGMVPPIEFIPFAEHTGYIKVLTRWVLDEAIRQCGVWHREERPLTVSVNISARDLMNRDLPDMIAEMLTRHGTPPSLVCLEITESGFMEDPTHAQKVLERLRKLGLGLSIDDYGTGFSSLSYIARLPVHELKIDRSFVQRMVGDATTSAIVRSTIELGHNLGLKVVAEGVENIEDMQLLAQFGCDQIQGYFLSKPLAPESLRTWLETFENQPLSSLATQRLTRKAVSS